MNNELKENVPVNCPYCGHESRLSHNFLDDYQYFVRCERCKRIFAAFVKVTITADARKIEWE